MEDKMGGAFSVYKGEKYTKAFGVNRKEWDYLEDTDIDGSTLLTFKNRASYI
jgi:hypothetical protein